MEQKSSLWKKTCDFIQRQKSGEFAHEDHKLQTKNMGDDFFETLGSMLECKPERETFECKQISALHSSNENNNVFNDIPKSKTEDDTEEFASDLNNTESLYVEILHAILHSTGSSEINVQKDEIFSYLQEVFCISAEQHSTLLEVATNKQPPHIFVNIEIIEAKQLASKDSNGLSDPFATLYLNSNSLYKQNTSVKTATLFPHWEEHFALPLDKFDKDSELIVEVWDFDQVETLNEKLKQIFDVKGTKGAYKYIKEIAYIAAESQNKNELIGVATIPLNNIPAEGTALWYALTKNNKKGSQGEIKVGLSYGSSKNFQMAFQEYKQLFKLLLLHEFQTQKITPNNWTGNLRSETETVLSQFIKQSGISSFQVELCRWIVFVTLHKNYALHFKVFTSPMKVLSNLLKQKLLSKKETDLFVKYLIKLLPYCFNVIRKRQKCTTKYYSDNLEHVLTIISTTKQLESLGLDYFYPHYLYTWLKQKSIHMETDKILEESIKQGVEDWFNYIVNKSDRNYSNYCENLSFIYQVINIVKNDIEKSQELFAKLYREKLNFDYSKTLYYHYQSLLANLTENVINDASKHFQQIPYYDNTYEQCNQSEVLDKGTKLFEIYVRLQSLVVIGKTFHFENGTNLIIENFYKWFNPSVIHWLQIALFKALQRIEKAIELDKLIPVDSCVNYTSSAVDTLTIFYQVKAFWNQLSWPDYEESFSFIAKMIDDICRCSIFYIERTTNKLVCLRSVDKKISKEWCLAINNIEHIEQALLPFAYELGMVDVLEKICECKGSAEASRCQETLKNVIENTIDTAKNEIRNLMDKAISEIFPTLEQQLIESAERPNDNASIIENLLEYLDENLQVFYKELNDENFLTVINLFWDNLSEFLEKTMESDNEHHRTPAFFHNLQKTVKIILDTFSNENMKNYNSNIIKCNEDLKVFGMETDDLIHQVHLSLWKQYSNILESQIGTLSIRTKLENNTLHVEILNCKNLTGNNLNDRVGCFVKIYVLPKPYFQNIKALKTQTEIKKKFLVFDRTFEIFLTDEQVLMKNGLILVSLKSSELLRYKNKYLGEGFIHFKDIPRLESEIGSFTQMDLHLSKPTNTDQKLLQILESRTGDKIAKKFLENLKDRASWT